MPSELRASHELFREPAQPITGSPTVGTLLAGVKQLLNCCRSRSLLQNVAPRRLGVSRSCRLTADALSGSEEASARQWLQTRSRELPQFCRNNPSLQPLC